MLCWSLLLLVWPAPATSAGTNANTAACTGPAASADLPVLQPLGRQRWWVAAARGEPDAVNAGRTAQLLLVRDGRRLWLVGSGPTPAFGAALACVVQRTLHRAVSDLVNTRAAPELAMGNAAFPQARVWALPDVARAMRLHCGDCQTRLKAQLGAAGDSLRAASIRVPTRAIGRDGQAAGRLGPFDWLALPRHAHERVLALRLHASLAGQEGLLLAQGLLWVGDLPDLRGTEAASLLASWQALRNWAGAAAVLGEQGGLADGQAIESHIAYLQALQGLIGPALARGEVLGSSPLDLPDWQAAPGYALRHPLNVQHVWLALEPALFR